MSLSLFGRTSDFDSERAGSNPVEAVMNELVELITKHWNKKKIVMRSAVAKVAADR